MIQKFSLFSSYSLAEVVREALSRNEAARTLDSHRLIASVHVNSLASNNPMEDRHCAHLCTNTGAALFAVIDGHGGWQCAEHIRQQLSTYASAQLKDKTDLKFVDILDGVLEVSEPRSGLNLTSDFIINNLRQTFVNLDGDMTNTALNAVRKIAVGHSMTTELKERILQAITGACVNSVLLNERDIYTANTGDCRAVIGRRKGKKWLAVPLSHDQCFENKKEVERLSREHPGETNTVISHERLLGGLQPFRSFGDAMYKWQRKDIEVVYQQTMPNYHTPPYLTAEPEITQRTLDANDKFLVLASDGLWERLSSEEVVQIVGSAIDNQHAKKSLFGGKRRSDTADVSNLATDLLRHSLGPGDESIYMLLTKEQSRMHRDDITIVIVTFK